MKGVSVACALTVLALVPVSCAWREVHRPNLPWRTIDPASMASANPERDRCPAGSPPPLTLDDLANEPSRASIRCVSHEAYAAGEVHPGFDLHVVEFDDQGLFWNREQVEASLASIAEARERGDVLVVTFIHGWFNNADVCNSKLACFRELLALVAGAETQYMARQRDATTGRGVPRRVIGVYVGWRGETIAVPGVKHAVTFWGRKAAAHTVGENGAVTELVARLSRIVRRQTGTAIARRPEELSSLVVVGHSFGGALLLSAVGNELSRAAGIALGDTAGDGQVIDGLADLVVLINPAVEASRFENFRRAAARARFSPRQLPIFLTLSSEADRPNQTLFPIGQALAFSQKAARSRQQWLGMIESLGTFEANHTHRLIARGADPPRLGEQPPCGCNAGIRDYAPLLLADLEGIYERLRQAAPGGDPIDALAQGRRREFLYSRIEPTQDADPHSPFMMVQVDDDVIGGHSDIFNQRIVDFMLEFFLLAEAKRSVIQAAAR